MSYDKVSQAKSIIIGTKQTVKALKRGSVKEVVVAKTQIRYSRQVLFHLLKIKVSLSQWLNP